MYVHQLEGGPKQTSGHNVSDLAAKERRHSKPSIARGQDAAYPYQDVRHEAKPSMKLVEASNIHCSMEDML